MERAAERRTLGGRQPALAGPGADCVQRPLRRAIRGLVVGAVACSTWRSARGQRGSPPALVRVVRGVRTSAYGRLDSVVLTHRLPVTVLEPPRRVETPSPFVVPSPPWPPQANVETVPVEPVTLPSGQYSRVALERVKMCLDGHGTYAVVSALVVNMGIRMVSAMSEEAMAKVWWPLGCTYCASLVACVLSGVYATVVFTLTKMYSKTAIGLYRDAAFSEFFRGTARYRQSGFIAFCTSLGCFAFAFVTSFLFRVRGLQGAVGFTVGVLLVSLGVADFIGIYRLAARMYLR